MGRLVAQPAGVPRKSRLVVFLPMYLADWQSHQVRTDVHQWAPHLPIYSAERTGQIRLRARTAQLKTCHPCWAVAT